MPIKIVSTGNDNTQTNQADDFNRRIKFTPTQIQFPEDKKVRTEEDLTGKGTVAQLVYGLLRAPGDMIGDIANIDSVPPKGATGAYDVGNIAGRIAIEGAAIGGVSTMIRPTVTKIVGETASAPVKRFSLDAIKQSLKNPNNISDAASGLLIEAGVQAKNAAEIVHDVATEDKESYNKNIQDVKSSLIRTPIAITAPFIPQIVLKSRTNIQTTEKIPSKKPRVRYEGISQGKPKFTLKPDAGSGQTIYPLNDVNVDIDVPIDPKAKANSIPVPDTVEGVGLGFMEKTKERYTYIKRRMLGVESQLRSLGKSGGELADRIVEMIRWRHEQIGSASYRVASAIINFTDDDMRILVKLADQGPDAVAKDNIQISQKVMDAYEIWADELDKVGDIYNKLGATVRLPNGQNIPFAQARIAHFFPHYHDIDKLMRDPKTKDLVENAFMKATREEAEARGLTLSEHIKQIRLRKSEGLTNSLYQRESNLPYWMGDPDNGTFSGEDAKRSMMMFLEDNYSEISTRQFLGTKDASKNILHGEFGLANLSTIKGALKEKLKELKILTNDDIAQVGKDNLPSGPYGVANSLVEAIKDESGLAAASYARNVLDYASRSKLSEPESMGLTQAARNIQIITRLSLAAVQNLSQSAFTATQFGIWNTAKSMIKVFREDQLGQSLQFAHEIGGLTDDVMQIVGGDMTKSISGRLAKGILNVSQFSRIERYNRKVAAEASVKWMANRFVTLAKNPSDKDALRQLRRIGFRDKELSKYIGSKGLTQKGASLLDAINTKSPSVYQDELMKAAGYRGIRATQFMAELVDSPLFAASPWGKVAFQFKTFTYNATRMIVNSVLGELKHGNPMPLFRLAVAGAVAGEITANASSILSGRDPRKRGSFNTVSGLPAEWFGLGANPTADENVLASAFGHEITNGKAKHAARRYIENVASIGALGLFLSITQSAVLGGRSGIAEFVGGPTFGTGVDLGADIVNAAISDSDKRFDPIGRDLINMIPFVGRTAASALLPTDKQLRELLPIYQTGTDEVRVKINHLAENFTIVHDQIEEELMNGNKDEAIRLAREWNQISFRETRPLMRDIKALPNLDDKIKMANRVGPALRFSVDELINISNKIQKDREPTRLESIIRDIGIDKILGTAVVGGAMMLPGGKKFAKSLIDEAVEGIVLKDLAASGRVLTAEEGAQRLARAEKQGYKISGFHGTKGDITEFDPGRLGETTGAGSAKQGFFFSKDPVTAESYIDIADASKQRENLPSRDDAISAYRKSKNHLDNIMFEIDPQKYDVSVIDHLGEYKAKYYTPIRNVTDRFKDVVEFAAGNSTSEGIKTSQAILDKLINDKAFLRHFVEFNSGSKNIDLIKDIELRLDEYIHSTNALDDLFNNAKTWNNVLSMYDEYGEYTFGNIIPVRLRMTNPLEYDYKGSSYREESYYSIIKQAKKNGHDGVIFKNTYDGGPETDIYVVFDPENIRSAYAKFDPKSAPRDLSKRMEKAERGAVKRLSKMPGDSATPFIGPMKDKVNSIRKKVNASSIKNASRNLLASGAGISAIDRLKTMEEE